jgi:tRNA (guanine26-N2/guanine27-N2)-dimethyltransferase
LPDQKIAGMDFPTTMVREGAASLRVPDITQREGEPLEQARSRSPVFFNPTMKINRDSAVLALAVHQARISRQLAVCEPMCGTGVRGVRLALETPGVERIVMGDMNSSAVRLAQENARLNGVSDSVSVRLMEANLLLSLHSKPLSRFDYVDIDPYGSPAPYLDEAVRACKRDGLLALTATDMAPLCGVNPRACLRKYGGRSIRTEYCHESALRLVAGALVVKAATHEISARPVFSYAADHYVRLYMGLERGKKKADRRLSKMGYILHCFKCLNRRAVPSREVFGAPGCERCGSPMGAAGPMWLGELAEEAFCDDMLSVSDRSAIGSNRRLIRVIKTVRGEIGFPQGFYGIDKLCSKLKIPSKATGDVMGALEEASFRVARTHIDERGLKTDAPIGELEGVLKSIRADG